MFNRAILIADFYRGSLISHRKHRTTLIRIGGVMVPSIDMSPSITINGDLNTTSASRIVNIIKPDPAYLRRSLAIPESDDDPEIRKKYRPFLLDQDAQATDCVSKLELSTALKLSEASLEASGCNLQILVLYGSLGRRYAEVIYSKLRSMVHAIKPKDIDHLLFKVYRKIITSRTRIPADTQSRRSFSRLLAFEACRILFRLGCDVRVFDPTGLPVKDDVLHEHPRFKNFVISAAGVMAMSGYRQNMGIWYAALIPPNLDI